MYLNCKTLHNSQRARPDTQDKNDTPLTRGPAGDNNAAVLSSKAPDKKEGRPKDNMKENLYNSDWSHLEGVYATELSAPEGREKVTHFLSALCEILTSYVVSETDHSSKVLDFHHPHQLKEMMSHCLGINSDPTDLEQILSDCRETLKYCVKTGHPHFLNQLSTGIDVIGMSGAWLAATANTNMFTYEVAPVFTLMEEVVFTHMRDLIGWPDGDAILVPGGALANLYGVLLARYRALPQVKQTGLTGAIRPVVFTSEQSHFSIKRAAVILGIGTDNVVFVKCLSSGKMDVADLKDKLMAAQRSGGTPIFVNATCGTTVLGAFDPLLDLVDVCDQHGLWLHVDAAWGGGALLSRDYKYLLQGIDRADSVTWNPHKMMGVPLQCSAFLTRHKDVLATITHASNTHLPPQGLMTACNSMGATYLFQKDKHYDVNYDTGDLSIQCGRHNDVFKLWLMWRAKGDLGFEEQINKNFQLAMYLRDKVKERAGFHLVLDTIECPNVCFWYLPPAWRTRPIQKIKNAHLHKVAPLIKAKMMETGSLMVQYQPLGDLPNLFRIAISNPILTSRDLEFMLDEIDSLGRDIPVPLDWDN